MLMKGMENGKAINIRPVPAIYFIFKMKSEIE